jgi:hypothetical protein
MKGTLQERTLVTGLLILTLGAIAAGIFALAVKVGQLVPPLRSLAAYAERLERESAGLDVPDRSQKLIQNLVKDAPSGAERGIGVFIREIFGRPAGDEYFAKHPADAERFGWDLPAGGLRRLW